MCCLALFLSKESSLFLYTKRQQAKTQSVLFPAIKSTDSNSQARKKKEEFDAKYLRGRSIQPMLEVNARKGRRKTKKARKQC
jgi:hypothetical protein